MNLKSKSETDISNFETIGQLYPVLGSTDIYSRTFEHFSWNKDITKQSIVSDPDLISPYLAASTIFSAPLDKGAVKTVRSFSNSVKMFSILWLANLKYVFVVSRY